MLSEMAWNFWDSPGSEIASTGTPESTEIGDPVHPWPPLAPETFWQRKEKPIAHPPSLRASPISDQSDVSPESRDPRQLPRQKSGAPSSRTEPGGVETPEARNVPWPDSKFAIEASVPPGEQISARPAKRSIQASQAGSPADHSFAPPHLPAPPNPEPVFAYADPQPPVAKAAPRSEKESFPALVHPEVGGLEQAHSPLHSSPAGNRAPRLQQAAIPEPSPEPSRSGVIIDNLQVEVVMPPVEKPAPRPVAAAPLRSTPASRIGPLRGVSKHLAFSVRHR
jgi:hypothetical protein